MTISLYIYDNSNLINNPILPKNISNHISNYRNDDKRRISNSNYSRLCKKLNELKIDINTFDFDKGKPIVKGINISCAHSKKYHGFSISNLNHGLDFEEIIDNDKLDKFANRILKENELKIYNDVDNKANYLTKIWCEIEAAGKLDGNGIDMKFIHPNYIYKSFMIDNTMFVLTAKEEFDIELYVNDIQRGI